MSFDYIRKLPTPDEIREQYPVPDSLVPIKQKRDAEIRDVLTGNCLLYTSPSPRDA